MGIWSRELHFGHVKFEMPVVCSVEDSKEVVGCLLSDDLHSGPDINVEAIRL